MSDGVRFSNQLANQTQNPNPMISPTSYPIRTRREYVQALEQITQLQILIDIEEKRIRHYLAGKKTKVFR